MNEEIKKLIDAADKAIKEERFDDLKEFLYRRCSIGRKTRIRSEGKKSD